MLVSRKKFFRHSIEVTPASLRAFFNLVESTKIGAGESEPETVVRLVRSDGSQKELSLDDLLAERNEKSRSVQTVVFSKVDGERALSIQLGWNKYYSVLLTYSDPPEGEGVDDEAIGRCHREVSNVTQKHALLGLADEWVDDHPPVRFILLMGVLAFVLVWCFGLFEYYQSERALTNVIQEGLLEGIDAEQLDEETQAKYQAIREFVESDSFRSRAVKVGVPLGTILGVVVQVLYVILGGVLIVVWGKVFPKILFLVGDGEDRAARLRKAQYTAIVFCVTGIIYPWVKSLLF